MDRDKLIEMARRKFNRRGPPNWKTLAETFDDGFRVMDRKSLWMVEYLRGRRGNDGLVPLFRKQHLAEAAALRALAEGDGK
jgi:hypothetical protein